MSATTQETTMRIRSINPLHGESVVFEGPSLADYLNQLAAALNACGWQDHGEPITFSPDQLREGVDYEPAWQSVADELADYRDEASYDDEDPI